MERYHVIGGHLRLDPEGTVTSYDDAQRALDAEREKVKFGSCEACWNLAWVLCRDDEPNAVPMKCANGTTYWRCDYCWYKQQLATLQAQLRQVEGERDRLKGDMKERFKTIDQLDSDLTTLRQLVEALLRADERGRGVLFDEALCEMAKVLKWDSRTLTATLPREGGAQPNPAMLSCGHHSGMIVNHCLVCGEPNHDGGEHE